MGRFIRVWRREWAGLSREQLAIAVSGLCRGRPRVSRHGVQAWEEGQPPHSTEELEALLTVMGRHGLNEEEAEDFRRTVFAACASRQYPELFLDDGIAYRPDVDSVAESLYVEYLTFGSRRVTHPHLLVIVDELALAVDGGQGPPPGRGQRRKQLTALALARAALGIRQGGARGRKAWWAADLLDRNAEFVNAHLGPTCFAGRASVLGQRAAAAYYRAHGGRSLHWAQRLLAFCEIAEAGDEVGVAADAYIKAAHALNELEPGSWGHLVEGAAARLEAATLVEHRDSGGAPHLDLAWAQLAAEDTDSAERVAAELSQWWVYDAATRDAYQEVKAWVALARGDLTEARRWTPPSGPFAPAFERAEELRRPVTYQEWLRWQSRGGGREGR
jgi:Helix-turn-helix domain